MNLEQKALESLNESLENETHSAKADKLKEIQQDEKFEILIETCLTSFTEMQIAIQDMLKFKDELLLHFLPPPLIFKLTIIIGKVFRSFSDLNTPVNEIIRLVKIYSSSWEKNSIILKKIHDMYENKKQLLNLAIKRLAMVDKKTKLFSKEKKVLNWEKLFIKVSESKGHGRRWRFQMESFRKKADLGNEELVKWIMREQTERFEDIRNNKELEKNEENLTNDNEKKNFDDRHEKSNLSLEMKSKDDLTKNFNDENYINEIDSMQDFFSQDSSVNGEKETEKKEVGEKSVQTEPEMIDKSIWTGEPNFSRFIILRLFKPAEFYYRKLQFEITLGNIKFTSKSFDVVKKVVIVDNKSQPKNIKQKFSKPELIDKNKESEKKIDYNKYEDFVFEVKDYSQNKEFLSISNEDSIEIKLKGLDENEELLGYAILPLDDVHTLDLPILYHKEDKDEIILENQSETKTELKNLQSSKLLDSNELTDESINRYQILSKRSPFTFEMYKNKNEKNDPICKLPLMFFWVRKQKKDNCNKQTNTQSLKDMVENLTGFNIEKQSLDEIQGLLKPKITQDIACSPIPADSIESIKNDIRSPIQRKEDLNQHGKIQEIHEEYQMKINELNLVIDRLQNEISMIKSLNDLKASDFYDINKKKINLQNNYQQNIAEKKIKLKTKSGIDTNNSVFQQNSEKKSVWNRNINEGFYHRLKQFNEKSYLHHKEIIEKYVSQEAAIIEQQMAVQHRLDTNNYNDKPLEDFCLPAVFMPFKSVNNVFNPRARQYFHASGTDIRITQPPSIFQLPALPSRPTLSVTNLYDLGLRYEAGEPDLIINEYINTTASKLLKQTKNDEN